MLMMLSLLMLCSVRIEATTGGRLTATAIIPLKTMMIRTDSTMTTGQGATHNLWMRIGEKGSVFLAIEPRPDA